MALYNPVKILSLIARLLVFGKVINKKNNNNKKRKCKKIKMWRIS